MRPTNYEMDGTHLRLRHTLAAQLAPLVTLLVVVIGMSAPLAYYVLGRKALREQAESMAQQIAHLVREDAQERPRLWRYDTPKLLDHLRSYEVYPEIERVEVVDDQGRLIGPDVPRRSRSPSGVTWGGASIRMHGRDAGRVWVAVSTDGLYRNSGLLLVVFLSLGGLVGGLLYRLPLRFIGRAERRIVELLERLEESRTTQVALNESLEQKVQQRSEELRGAYSELQRVSARAVNLQEAERRAIARELHDGVGQSLTAIRLHLQLLSAQLGNELPELRRMSEKTTGWVDDTMEEIRRAVNRLGPAVLDDVGLELAVSRLIEDLVEVAGLEVEYSPNLPVAIDPSTETTCYRVVQEALTNIARHAQASRVMLRMGSDRARGGLCLQIHDDGIGIPEDAVDDEKRGLTGMRERVELLGGELRIDSASGQGTRIEVWLPPSSSSADLAQGRMRGSPLGEPSKIVHDPRT